MTEVTPGHILMQHNERIDPTTGQRQIAEFLEEHEGEYNQYGWVRYNGDLAAAVDPPAMTPPAPTKPLKADKGGKGAKAAAPETPAAPADQTGTDGDGDANAGAETGAKPTPTPPAE